MIMEVSIRPTLAEEQKYTNALSRQLCNTTGHIGRFCCDFGSCETGSGKMQPDANAVRKFEEMRIELDGVFNFKRIDDCQDSLLRYRNVIVSYVQSHPDSIMDGNEPRRYALRFDIGNFVYLLDRTLLKEDHNYYCDFYCWCYANPTFDRYLKNARRGIRFITPDYKELFRIPNGDQIRIIRPNGDHSDKQCWYIDDYHVEVGCYQGDVYHIYQLAELLERNGCTMIPLRSSLPEQCYGVLAETGEIIIFQKGENKYSVTDFATGNKENDLALVEMYNAKLDVSKAQAAAMQIGSMFGWAVPAADPANYDENGQLLKPKHRARDDAR